MDPLASVMSLPLVGPYVPYVTIVMAFCSIVGAALPPPQPAAGWLYVTVYNVTNRLACNFGHAKNEGLK